MRLPLGEKRTDLLVNEYAAKVAETLLELLLELIPVFVEDPSLVDIAGLPEGTLQRIEANKYVRSPRNRRACIKYHGARCKVCGFDFGTQYGPTGEGFIEVHHVVPVSQMGGSYIIDPITDLVPLCSNCHSMAHKDLHQQSPRSIQDLQSLLQGKVVGS